MALNLLCEITANIQKAKIFTILADEATDVGNKEQLTIIFCWVDEMLLIHEDLWACMRLMMQVLLVSQASTSGLQFEC